MYVNSWQTQYLLDDFLVILSRLAHTVSPIRIGLFCDSSGLLLVPVTFPTTI